MARGKAAAQNANRRTAEALARVSGLETRLTDQDAAHRSEVHTLSDEIRKLRNALDQQIGDRAAERVADVIETARLEREALRAEFEQRARAAVSVITDLHKYADVPASLAVDVAAALGVEHGGFVGHNLNRAGRRRVASVKGMRALNGQNMAAHRQPGDGRAHLANHADENARIDALHTLGITPGQLNKLWEMQGHFGPDQAEQAALGVLGLSKNGLKRVRAALDAERESRG